MYPLLLCKTYVQGNSEASMQKRFCFLLKWEESFRKELQLKWHYLHLWNKLMQQIKNHTDQRVTKILTCKKVHNQGHKALIKLIKFRVHEVLQRERPWEMMMEKENKIDDGLESQSKSLVILCLSLFYIMTSIECISYLNNLNDKMITLFLK